MSKSTKNRSKRSTNISGGLQKEIQALIAYACYDSPSLIRRGGSLGESAIENKMTSIFYGEGTNGADPNLITYDDQFLLGLNKFKGLYTQSVHVAAGGPTSSTGEVILSIPAFYTATRSSLSTLVRVRLIRRYCRKSHCFRLERRFRDARFIAMPRRSCAIARK
jgi:hypothetical protein